jgi:hypothetical protein
MAAASWVNEGQTTLFLTSLVNTDHIDTFIWVVCSFQKPGKYGKKLESITHHQYTQQNLNQTVLEIFLKLVHVTDGRTYIIWT